MSSNNLVSEEIFENGLRIDSLPKNIDFTIGTDKMNQVLTADSVKGFLEQRFTSIEDSGMLVTGLKMGG